jgi:hypothetical protein
MTLQPTRTQVHQRNDATPPAVEGPGQGGGLLAQAAAYANVAREAHQICEKGKAAEQALARRRNRSGQ